MSLALDLATIWAFIIAFAVFVYVVMDGFDLGLGILFPLFPAKADREFSRLLARKWIGRHLKQDTRLAAARDDRRRHLQSGAAAGNPYFHPIGGGCGIQADFTYRTLSAGHKILAAGERYRPDAGNRNGFDGGGIARKYP